MSEQPAPPQATPAQQRIQRGFEYVLFNSRWLMAPFYVGLVVALVVLLVKFRQQHSYPPQPLLTVLPRLMATGR